MRMTFQFITKYFRNLWCLVHHVHNYCQPRKIEFKLIEVANETVMKPTNTVNKIMTNAALTNGWKRLKFNFALGAPYNCYLKCFPHLHYQDFFLLVQYTFFSFFCCCKVILLLLNFAFLNLLFYYNMWEIVPIPQLAFNIFRFL